MASDDPLVIAAAAARGFRVLECQQCADKIKAALQRAGNPGEIVQIRAKAGGDFMVCLSYDGGAMTITQNGRHLGVRVGDVVFDNLHADGVAIDSWIRDFDAIGGIEIHATSPF